MAKRQWRFRDSVLHIFFQLVLFVCVFGALFVYVNKIRFSFVFFAWLNYSFIDFSRRFLLFSQYTYMCGVLFHTYVLICDVCLRNILWFWPKFFSKFLFWQQDKNGNGNQKPQHKHRQRKQLNWQPHHFSLQCITFEMKDFFLSVDLCVDRLLFLYFLS